MEKMKKIALHSFISIYFYIAKLLVVHLNHNEGPSSLQEGWRSRQNCQGCSQEIFCLQGHYPQEL
jgi:hypothetical protein